MSIKILYIFTNRYNQNYRRDILRSLLESDPRFEVEVQYTPASTDEAFALYDRIDKGGFDIALCSNPFWMDGLNDRAVAGIAYSKDAMFVYDLSDNWQKKTRSKRCMKMADFIGTSSRWLYTEAQKKCPSVGFYPNGIRCLDYKPDPDFTTTSKYVYAGQVSKIDLAGLDRLLALDPTGEVDLYAVETIKTKTDTEEGNTFMQNFKQLLDPRVHVLDIVPYETLMSRLHAYKYGLCLFEDLPNTNYGMLPDKFFDYCQAGLPTIYTHCTELAHEDFQKVAFDLNSEGFSFDPINPTQNDFEAVTSKYNMRDSLRKFIDRMVELYNDPDRPPAQDKRWHAPWEQEETK